MNAKNIKINMNKLLKDLENLGYDEDQCMAVLAGLYKGAENCEINDYPHYVTISIIS